MWVTFELIWMNFSAKNCNFMFFGIFPIINPIVNGNGWRYPKWRAINYFFVEIVSLHIDTAEKYWEKSQIGLCVFLGHPSAEVLVSVQNPPKITLHLGSYSFKVLFNKHLSSYSFKLLFNTSSMQKIHLETWEQIGPNIQVTRLQHLPLPPQLHQQQQLC